MSTFSTAQDQFVAVGKDGIKLSYRRLGPAVGTPLVMLMGFRSASSQLHLYPKFTDEKELLTICSEGQWTNGTPS